MRLALVILLAFVTVAQATTSTTTTTTSTTTTTVQADFAANPTLATSSNLNSVVFPGGRLALIRWSGCTSGDTAVLSNKSGRAIWTATCCATNETVESPMNGLTFPALTLTTLAHGTLELWIDNR